MRARDTESRGGWWIRPIASLSLRAVRRYVGWWQSGVTMAKTNGPPQEEMYRIAFYWGSREQELDACAPKVLDYLRGLHSANALFDDWKQVPAMKPVSVSKLESVKRVLTEGITKTDDNKPLPQAGCRLMLLCQTSEGKTVCASINCGSVVPGLGNLCLIELPNTSSVRREIFRVPVLLEICEHIVRSWDPDLGVVMS